MPEFKRIIDFKLPTGILGGSLSADGNQLAAGCMDGVYLADLQQRTHERIGLHSSYVSSAAFVPGSDTLATAGYDGVVQWFDATTKTKKREQKLHGFWSWDMAVSPDGRLIASVTGQYLAGGYKYEPQHETEPSVRIVNAATGEVLHSFPHVPSVQAVAFSNDSRYVAAGNLMSEVRVWDLETGHQAATFRAPDFTSWGIIKTHSYIGGVFAISFTPDDNHLLLAGMGQMQDPMAGNGRQMWQKWTWRNDQCNKVDETHKDESGEGLMEALAIHPNGKSFVMGGRLRGGEWNLAMFDLESGNRLTTLKTGYRITEACFTVDGSRLVLVGSQGQPKPKQDKTQLEHFGRVEVYEVA